MNLSQIAEKGLDGFSIQQVTEVYATDSDGRKARTITYIRDEKLAKAFAQQQKDPGFTKTERVWVLTIGDTGYIVRESQINLEKSEADLAKKVRDTALAKLTAEERDMLLNP